MAATLDVGNGSDALQQGDREIAFINMWRAACSQSNGRIPMWRELQPGALAAFVADIHVFTLCPGGMKVRLVGTNVDRIYGGNVRPGMVVPYFVSAQGMHFVTDIYASTLSTPCASRIERVMQHEGRILTGTSTALPLRSDGDTPDTIMVLYDLPAGLTADFLRGRKFHIRDVAHIDLGYGVPPLPEDLASRLLTELTIREDLKGQTFIDE